MDESHSVKVHLSSKLPYGDEKLRERANYDRSLDGWTDCLIMLLISLIIELGAIIAKTVHRRISVIKRDANLMMRKCIKEMQCQRSEMCL